MKSIEQIAGEGKLLREYRNLMGWKQIYAAKLFNTEQGNYSRMERGQLNSDWRLDKMREYFINWREIEIQNLQNRIDYLKIL